MGPLLSNATIGVPSFGGGTPFVALPLVSLLGIVTPIVYAGLSHAAALPITLVSVRPVALLNVALAGFITALSCLVAMLLGVLYWDQWLLFVRSSTVLMGMVALAASLVGFKSAALAPVLMLFLAAVFGHQPDGNVAVWAWLIDPQLKPWHLPASLALAAGFFLLAPLLRPRPRLSTIAV